jgi:predicted enzyme related to lactoylglutathione lyase
MSKIVHFEIPVDDGARAAAFYRDLLGWEVNGFGDQPYWLVRAGDDDEPGANGALISRGDVHRSPVVIAGVVDLDAVLSRVEECGGRVIQEKMAIPGVGWSAYVTDSEGNTIGFFEAATN